METRLKEYGLKGDCVPDKLIKVIYQQELNRKRVSKTHQNVRQMLASDVICSGMPEHLGFLRLAHVKIKTHLILRDPHLHTRQ